MVLLSELQMYTHCPHNEVTNGNPAMYPVQERKARPTVGTQGMGREVGT